MTTLMPYSDAPKSINKTTATICNCTSNYQPTFKFLNEKLEEYLWCATCGNMLGVFKSQEYRDGEGYSHRKKLLLEKATTKGGLNHAEAFLY